MKDLPAETGAAAACAYPILVSEIIELAGERKAWLLFCTGVKHAYHVAEVLRQRGVAAECVTGDTPKAERENCLKKFKAVQIRALTNANVLTTGFDYPDIDLIAMLRPTKSAGESSAVGHRNDVSAAPSGR